MKNTILALVLTLSLPAFAAENKAPVSGYCTDQQGQVAIRVFRVGDQLMAAWAYLDQKVAAFQHTLDVNYSISVDSLVAMTFTSDSTRAAEEVELYFEVGPFGRGRAQSTLFKHRLGRRGAKISCSFQY